MGCLFGKAKNTEDTANNEVQLQESNIQPVPFNDYNDSHFLGAIYDIIIRISQISTINLNN